MYDDVKGRKIVNIDCSEVDFTIERLSELGEQWEIPAICPTCKKEFYFTKNNVNKVITCECGQKVILQVLEKLL